MLVVHFSKVASVDDKQPLTVSELKKSEYEFQDPFHAVHCQSRLLALKMVAHSSSKIALLYIYNQCSMQICPCGNVHVSNIYNCAYFQEHTLLCLHICMFTLIACRQHMISFMHKCHAVTEQIMSCFALGLHLPEGFFKEVTAHKALSDLSALALCLLH